MYINIRSFIFVGFLILSSFLLISCNTPNKKQTTVLIVSGWQDVNIGDIAHTPGLLHLVEQNMPDAKIILWKVDDSEWVVDFLKKNFPQVEIIQGRPENNPMIDSVMNIADVFIHGSAPWLVASDHVKKWMSLSDKPFGFFGVTFEDPSQEHVEILKKASFIFPRDSESIQHLKRAGIEGKHVIFGPDATFALHIRDEYNALDFMNKHQLKEKEFLCVVTRLRKSPYWWKHPDYFTQEEITKRTALNQEWKHDDNDKLITAIIHWVRTMQKPVVICPEMDYQVKIWDELIIDKLPEDVKPFIIKHDYWLPDEAISLYSRAHSIISMECHTVIMAIAAGVPVLHLRQPQDTIKGQMFYDLLLGKWVFEIEESTGEQIVEQLSEIIQDYPKALQSIQTAQSVVEQQYKICFELLKESIR